MATQGRRTRPSEEKLIECLAAGTSYERAGAMCSCSARTVRRRMADDEFRARVRKARSAMLDRAVGVLSEGAGEAANALRELIRADDDRVRLAVCRSGLFVPIADPVRSGDQRRTCDDEAERDHASDDRDRSRPDRITEDQDTADDRNEVGRYRGESDDFYPRADLQATALSGPQREGSNRALGALGLLALDYCE